MGNSVNTSQGKGTSTTNGTGQPAWANTGSQAYKNMNSALATAPMAVANQTFAQGGLGKTGQGAVNTMNNMGQTGSNANMNAAGQTLSGYASGQYLNGSPELDNIINQTNQKVGDQVNQMFAAGGRYGSGMNQGVLADSIANNTSNLLYNNYNQQQQNQLNATGQLGQLGQAQFGNQLSALSGAAGLENQGFNNMLGTIGQLGNIQNNKVFDANQQMGIGSQFDQKGQNALNDRINQWSQSDMAPWARLGGLLSAGTTSAGNWGTQSGTSKTTQPINAMGILGLLASL